MIIYMITLEYLRHFRLFEYAIFDLGVSFLGMAIIAPLLSRLFLKMNISVPKINWAFLTLPLGIAVHLLVGRITPMTANFLDLHGHVALKLVVLISVLLGIQGIKIIRK